MIARCKDCGKTITVYNTLNRRCKECTIANYKPLNKIGKRTQEWLDMRSQWLVEDKIDGSHWQCEKCGQPIYVSSAVEYHHIKKRSVYPELRLKRDNVITLCELCHYDTHHPGGKL